MSAARSPRVSLLRAQVYPYALPFAVPLETPRGAMRERRGWLLALEDREGRRGWGDVAPWPGLGSDVDEVARELAELGASTELGGLPDECDETAVDALSAQARRASRSPEVAHGIELALLDLWGRLRGVRIAELLWRAPAARVATHQLVLDQPERDRRWLKMKVGRASVAQDLLRLERLRRHAHPEASLRLDVGGLWSLAEALDALPALASLGVSLLEQPLRVGAIVELARLRARAAAHGIAIAVDEAVRSEAELEAHLGAIDAVVLKPMFLGGLGAARRLGEAALGRGLEVIVTSALESAVGRTGALHLAAGLEGIHGVGPLAETCLASDVAEEPTSREGWVQLPAGAGLGLTPRAPSRSPSSPPRRAHSSVAPTPRGDEAEGALPNPLASAALARPDHPALICVGITLTYAELCDRAARRATTLRARGIEPGALVALSGPPSLDWVLGWHALGWLGAAVAPLPHGASARELDRLLGALGPVALVDPRELAPADEPAPERFWPLDEVRAVICTSGTSGSPRPVSLTSQQWLLSAFGSAIRLGLDPADRWLCCLPLHHVGGLSVLVRSTFYATTVVLHERFEAARVDDAIESGGATLVSLVPTMLERLLDARASLQEPGARRRDLAPFPPTLRAMLVGGAALPQPTLERCRDIAAPVSLTWGMTEAASQVATRVPGDLDPAGGVGAPLPFARVDSHAGRLRVRGPLVRGEHWSSDLGYVDHQGRVHVQGRADDVIVSGGEKIAPEPIETVLAEHPGVERAVVVAVPSRLWGERPAAVMVARAGVAPSAAELTGWCRQRLPSPAVPDSFHFWPELCEATLGKPARAAVRRRLEAEGAAWAEHGSAGEQAALPEPFDEPRGRSDGLEAFPRDEGVDQPRSRPHLAVLPAHHVGEGDGAVAQALDLELHQEPVVLPYGPLEVGLGMDQRHAHVVLGEELPDAVAELDQKLLVGRVAELEDAAEEEDPGSIHLEETRGDAMDEGHDDDGR